MQGSGGSIYDQMMQQQGGHGGGYQQGPPQGGYGGNYQQRPPMYQQQQQQPPMGGGMMMQPPQMGGGGMTGNMMGAGADSDFFKGFHDGVVRHGGMQFGSAMSWIGPMFVNLALFVGPIWWLRRRFAQQAAQMAKGGAKENKSGTPSFMDMMTPLKPKNYRVDVKGIAFKDVIGIPEAKEEVQQYVEFLSNPGRFSRLGARLPKGCLMTGQPGTGKTLLAKAIAGEAKVPFFSCSGADFIEMFGGSGPKRVRELFTEAKAASPCIVFIDEIDAIGSRSGSRGMGGGASEENRTINQLLAELDGLTSSEAIVVFAATNHADNIDKALLREGRFDRKVTVPMPDAEARRELFGFYLQKVITGDSSCKPPKAVKYERDEQGNRKIVEEELPVKVVDGIKNSDYAVELADRTPGVSPAQIATIVNEAALACAVQEKEVVNKSALHNAIDDVLIGKKHRQRMGKASLRRTAYHESGHAIAAWLSPHQKDVIKISVIPRGRAGGYTQQVQNEALDPHTDEFLFSQLCVLLGGRLAEKIIFADVSTGAVDDLQRATKTAMDKLLKYGMSKKIGNMAFKEERDDGRAYMPYSEELHAMVETEARELVHKAYMATKKILEENKDKLTALSEALLEKEELMRADVEKILGPRPKLEGAGTTATKLETK